MEYRQDKTNKMFQLYNSNTYLGNLTYAQLDEMKKLTEEPKNKKAGD